MSILAFLFILKLKNYVLCNFEGQCETSVCLTILWISKSCAFMKVVYLAPYLTSQFGDTFPLSLFLYLKFVYFHF